MLGAGLVSASLRDLPLSTCPWLQAASVVFSAHHCTIARLCQPKMAKEGSRLPKARRSKALTSGPLECGLGTPPAGGCPHSCQVGGVARGAIEQVAVEAKAHHVGHRRPRHLLHAARIQGQQVRVPVGTWAATEGGEVVRCEPAGPARSACASLGAAGVGRGLGRRVAERRQGCQLQSRPCRRHGRWRGTT